MEVKVKPWFKYVVAKTLTLMLGRQCPSSSSLCVAPTNNILVTYGALQVLYCIVCDDCVLFLNSILIQFF